MMVFTHSTLPNTEATSFPFPLTSRVRKVMIFFANKRIPVFPLCQALCWAPGK